MKINSSRFALPAPARACLAGLMLLQSGSAAAISIGQIDTFSDGTLQGWAMGRDAITLSHMFNVGSGGPAGAGDGYLEVIADNTAVAGGRLTFFNKAQWSGDYLGTGVSAIAMDLYNFSSSEALNLRLALNGGFLDAGFNLIGGLFASTASVSLDSGSGWTHVVFSLDPADLVSISGRSGTTGNDVLATLGNVLELRLLNSAVPDWEGLPVSATLGIDNIQVVPLPPASWLFGSGLLGLGLLRRRRQGPCVVTK